MNEGQAYEWHIELHDMRERVRWAINNLNELNKRNDVKGQLETVLSRLSELCELTKGDQT